MMISNQILSDRHARGYLAILTGLLLLVALVCIGMWAQPSRPSSPSVKPSAPAAVVPAQSAPTHEMNAADLEAFLDGLMPAQLEREDVAGAVIAVVKDGHVIFAKGYGYSDMAKRTPVSPDNTLFRPGSISKLFTWTSVMQLVEQGKLDLDRDANDYLDFKIPPAFGKPITLRNIMTHTSGFEEIGKDLFVADAQHMDSLEYYVKNHIPERIFPPGTVPAYSNYATTLAGYIVQRVSGKPFEQYVAENIFTPLEMKRTTFVQPLPEDLKPMMSNGYDRASSDPKPFEFVEAFPAGSVSTTARDMGNFMIAHLQNGQFGSAQILRPETATLMHSRAFGADDRMNGMAHGFYEESANGHRIIGHAGDTELFHSDLHLILDSNVGLFVSYNSAGKGELSPRTVLFEKFLDRYFPYTQPPPGKIENAKADAASVAGLYLNSRRFESSLLKLTSLLGESKVFANPDGTISIDPLKGPNGQLLKFEEISPLLYREVHGRAHIGFKRDGNGQLQFQLDWPFFIFQKVGFWENKYFNYTLAIFGLVMVVLTVLLWPVGALIRKHYGRPLDLSPLERKLRLSVRLVCVLFICFSGGWLAVLAKAMADPSAINALAPWIICFGVLGVLCAFGAVLVCVNTFRSWSAPNRWLWTKLHDTALALACLGLVWFAITWNLMNFNMHY
jgi:CubicO group peptidase (beta-lactamase class C family)